MQIIEPNGPNKGESMIDFAMRDPIGYARMMEEMHEEITECEIIEPKQLPSSKK